MINTVRMHFKSIFPLLGLAASASAQVSASQMTANIDQITQKSSETNDIAKSISITNFFSTGPVCYAVPYMCPEGLLV